MVKRQVIEVPGVNHGANPIPLAVKVGNMVFTSGVMGVDPDAHGFPAEPEKQAELMFRHIRSIMEKAGGSPDNIAHVTVFLKDLKYREALNVEWNKMFPDEHSRPARHTLRWELGGDMLMQCELVAVLD